MTNGDDQTEALIDAVVAIADDLDLDATLHRTVRTARELTGARYAALGVLNDDGDGLSRFIHDGLDEATAAALGPLPTGRGLLGEVIRDPRPLRIADVDDHPASVDLPRHHPPVEGFLGVPVRVAGEVFGNLYLTGANGGGFGDDDERVLLALATIAGSAIGNAGSAARLTVRAQLQHALAELSTSVLAGATPDEVESAVEVAAAALLPGATAKIDDADADADDSPGVWRDHLGDDDAAPVLRLTVTDVSPWRLTGDARESVATLCHQAGVALGWAHARTEVRRLAIAGERDRIARDLHDTVIQRLFGAGLQLDAAGRAAAPTTAEAIERVIGEVDAAIAELRTTIGRLDAPVPQDLDARLGAVVGALVPVCPGLVTLTVDGRLRDVPEAIRDDLPAVLREGISNAARHAAASTVTPHIVVTDDEVQLTVTDDGVGPPPDMATSSDGPGSTLGLRNLTARAVRHGGTCQLEALSSGGSRLVWRVSWA